MKKLFLLLFVSIGISAYSQTDNLSLVRANKQKCFSKNIPAGNYSGITRISDSKYAVVSDKSEKDGFFVFNILIDSVSGDIIDIKTIGFHHNGTANRDIEGIVFYPENNTVFICGEEDSSIFEYDLDGKRTGRQMDIPTILRKSSKNYGFESLAYNENTKTFWTSTESTIPADGMQATSKNNVRNKIRIQSFDKNLKAKSQYAYLMGAPTVTKDVRNYALGISDITALDDGKLLVLERELCVPKIKIGAFANCKIYVVNPQKAKEIMPNEPISEASEFLEKRLLYEWKTRFGVLKNSFANYEGMCMGPKLADGTQTIILISDSQNNYAGILKDWFKTLVIRL